MTAMIQEEMSSECPLGAICINRCKNQADHQTNTKEVMHFFFQMCIFIFFSPLLQIGAKRKLLLRCVDWNTERPTGVLVTPKSLSRLFERDLTIWRWFPSRTTSSLLVAPISWTFVKKKSARIRLNVCYISWLDYPPGEIIIWCSWSSVTDGKVGRMASHLSGEQNSSSISSRVTWGT